jgi:hypothetical protein
MHPYILKVSSRQMYLNNFLHAQVALFPEKGPQCPLALEPVPVQLGTLERFASVIWF